ncbi:MFS transporter [Nocardia sp. NPDC057030]|uniref:MFS transporter n=1 Tax=unclassified Nocardia TaxID=2637762 RepID=UPI00362C1E45
MMSYNQLLRTRYVRALLTTNFIGRIPNGSGTVAILIYLTQSGFSYGRAGLAAAAYGIATAIGSPILGRAIDRTRQVPVLLASSIASGCGYILLAVVDPTRTAILVFGCVIMAGLFTPPLEACLRTIWSAVLRDDKLVHSAFALDSGLQELIFIVGPLLAAGCAAMVNPSFGLVFVTVLSVAGTVAYCLIDPVARWTARRRTAEPPIRWWGPLGRISVDSILVSFLFIGAALGILNLTAVAFANDNHSPGQSGIILGANSFGALIGGIAYGRRAPRSAAVDHLPLLCGALMLGYVPTACVGLLGSSSLPMLCATVFVAGIPLAPTIAAAFVAISTQTLPGTETEVFAWLVSMVLLGTAAGAAISGILIAGGGWGAGGALIVVPLVIATVTTWLAKQFKLPVVTRTESFEDEPIAPS